MNGELVQLVGLTWHANAALAGAAEVAFADDPTVQLCDSIVFVVPKRSALGGFKEHRVAGSPDAWFAWLRAAGVKGVRLAFAPEDNPEISDRVASAFVGGGGDWRLDVLMPAGTCEHWLPRWETGDQNGSRLWRVTYGLAGTSPKPPAVPATADVTARFAAALRDIHAFAARHNCDPFTGSFQAALDCLADPEHCAKLRASKLSEALPSEAVALWNAAGSAWVFGGMGSWNDMGFDGDAGAEYERVSENLYNALREAIVAAANGSLPNASGRKARP